MMYHRVCLVTVNMAALGLVVGQTQSLWVQVVWDSLEAAQGRSYSSRL